MKLLLDEYLSPRQALVLRENGHDAISVIEAGLFGCPNSEVRGFAILESRVRLTMDADFANMLRFPPAGTPGVIRVKIHPPTEAAIEEQIRKALLLLKDTRIAGCLAVSTGDMIRIRS